MWKNVRGLNTLWMPCIKRTHTYIIHTEIKYHTRHFRILVNLVLKEKSISVGSTGIGYRCSCILPGGRVLKLPDFPLSENITWLYCTYYSQVFYGMHTCYYITHCQISTRSQGFSKLLKKAQLKHQEIQYFLNKQYLIRTVKRHFHNIHSWITQLTVHTMIPS